MRLVAVAQALQSMNQVAGQVILVELVQVEVADRHRGTHIPTSWLETVKTCLASRNLFVLAAACAASNRAVFKCTFTLGIRLLLRLPADSLLPGQTPA
jgi:hypothetical protein